MSRNYLIVGLGPAGLRAAEAIREHDPDGEITIVSEEPHPHYYRASLPYFAVGNIPRAALWAAPERLLDDLRVRRVTGRVTGLDVAGRTATTERGASLPYDRLLLATGQGPRALGCPGADLPGVLTLATLDDAERVREWCAAPGRVVVAGGGHEALSIAWVARRLGMDVTVLAPGHQVGAPWLDARGSQLLYRRLVEDGVDVRLSEGIASIEEEDGRVAAVSTTGGKGIACKWVGAGTGGQPRSALADAAGIGTPGEAVPVDVRMATDRPAIFAAGDLCRVRRTDGPGTHHLTGWHAATVQGRVAGINMAGGEAAVNPDHHHYAFTLYDMRVTLIGRYDARGDAEVTSSPSSDEYRRLVFQDGRLIGVVLLGDTWHGQVLKRAVEMGVDVRRHELQMLRTDVDLNHLLRPSGEFHLY